jgi:dTDP-4-amino-4,6-dideoxygalactose transaminase
LRLSRFHQYTLRIIDADRKWFDAAFIRQRNSLCYIIPIPLHSQKHTLIRYKEEDFPVTNQLVTEVLSMHTELDDEQIKFITDLF